MRGWKQRYFVLQERLLLYFKADTVRAGCCGMPARSAMAVPADYRLSLTQSPVGCYGGGRGPPR